MVDWKLYNKLMVFICYILSCSGKFDPWVFIIYRKYDRNQTYHLIFTGIINL